MEGLLARDKKVSPVSRLHWEGRVEVRLHTHLKVRERRDEDGESSPPTTSTGFYEQCKGYRRTWTHKLLPRDNCWRPTARLRFAGKVP